MPTILDPAIFRAVQTERDGARVAAWVGGQGPPVLLLHGYPQTHVMWHRVAPELVAERRVVLADLRGYGASAKPGAHNVTALHSKREMARDILRLLDVLEIDAVDVVGHDRGGRVAHRLALDAPERVRTLAVLDIVPTLLMYDNVNRSMAEQYFHWFFLTRPRGLPERLINSDPDAWLAQRFEGRHARGLPFDREAVRIYREAFTPDVVAASCADYRAAATVDLVHDRHDSEAGHVLSMPVLALWGEHSYVGRTFDVLAAWQAFASNVCGAAVDADHYLAEENPSATLAELHAFWGGRADTASRPASSASPPVRIDD